MNRDIPKDTQPVYFLLKGTLRLNEMQGDVVPWFKKGFWVIKNYFWIPLKWFQGKANRIVRWCRRSNMMESQRRDSKGITVLCFLRNFDFEMYFNRNSHYLAHLIHAILTAAIKKILIFKFS